VRVMERESWDREKLRDTAPELFAALVAMVEEYRLPTTDGQRGARLFATMVLRRAKG